jgi:hypothetical protein
MDVTKLAIGGVAIIPLVAGLVQFSKRLKVQGNALLVEAFVLGVVFAATAGAISLDLIPALAVPWIQVAFIGLAGGVAGAATTGLYDLAKSLLRPQTILSAEIPERESG